MRYSGHSLIGEGGLATVHRVIDERGKAWALKKLRADVGDAKQSARFRQEIRIQTELNHANIVPVVAANARAELPFYIMPVANGNLEECIPQISKHPEKLRPIAEQLMDGLAYAHTENVLHRDLKPSNILQFDDVFKIADFGLGKVIDGKASYETTKGDMWLSLWYAPPEQHTCLSECDARSDIFSLGKVFLHCLTSRRPSEIPKDVDSRWQYLLRKCLRDRKEDRWPSVDELRRQYDLVFGIASPIVIDPDDLLGQLSDVARHDGRITKSVVDNFAAQFSMLEEDEVLFKRVFVSIPSNLIDAWCKHDLEGFRRNVKRYDEIVATNTSFSYCDTIADHYYLLHTECDDLEIRQIVRERLFTLGPLNNRWHVGGALSKILATIRDPAEIASVIELLQSDRASAKWNAPYLKSAAIDARIREALPTSKLKSEGEVS